MVRLNPEPSYRLVQETQAGHTLDDKKAALALAKECPAEVTAIGAAMGKSRGPDGKWA